MKKTNPVVIVHFVLAALLICFGVYSAVKMFSGAQAGSSPEINRLALFLYGAVNVFNVLALLASVVYLWNSYSKKAAGWYKTFMYLNVAVTLLLLAVDCFYMAFNFILVSSVILLAVKAAALLTLTFKKDLGKKNTWIVFFAVLTLDVVLAVFAFISAGRENLVYVIHDIASRFINDLVIALAIRGKYADKDRRGTT